MVFLKMQQLLQETKLSTAGDKSVFKSLAVDRHSKTPYSDATQVWSLMNCTVILSFMALYSMSEFVKPTATMVDGGAQKKCREIMTYSHVTHCQNLGCFFCLRTVIGRLRL